MSFRKEKKYRLSRYDFDLIKSKLLLDGMKRIYEKRKVNSVYYDTELHDMFTESEEGLLSRKKVRLRWYNSASVAHKEVKISSIEGRYKTSSLLKITSHSKFPQFFYEPGYGIIYPALLISYTREYFVYKNMRITFDSDINYNNLRRCQNITYKDGENVMEVKVSTDVTEDYIESILPYATMRFSKYSRGLLISTSEL